MEMQTQAAPLAPVVEKSLLDSIVERQAEVASRYMPVMDTAQVVRRMKAIQELKAPEEIPLGCLCGVSVKPCPIHSKEQTDGTNI